jgi:hypothetical protein
VHLHLSSEQDLIHEIVDLVARTPDGMAAGRLVERWVQAAVNGWVTGFPHRDTSFDAYIRLLAWDLVGTALAYDALQEWFRETVDEWFNASLPHRQHSPAVLMLVHNLVQNIYGVVAWEHVARAFRPEY